MKDYKGQRYHKLTLLSNVRPGGGTVGRIWMAQCDCGNVLEVSARNVKAGRVRSCGKCPKELTEPRSKRGGYRARTDEERRLRRLLVKSIRKSVREGVKWHMDANDINKLDLAHCLICRSELSIRTLVLEFVDPEEGYTVSNTKAICPTCKRRMLKDNLLEFLTYMDSCK